MANTEERNITDGLLIDQAKRIIETAADRNIPIRTVGSIGFRLLCESDLHLEYERSIGDIDVVGLKKDRKEIHSILEDEFDYSADKELMMAGWDNRLVFYGSLEEVTHEVDVFLDELDLCHRIDVADRIELGPNPYTLSPSDLFLEKSQIVEINEKDIIDLVILLDEFPITTDESGINKSYIATLLANNWGFYYTVTRNLDRLESAASKYADSTEPLDRIEELRDAIEEEPKTFRWKARSKVGTRLQWYEEVEEKTR